MGLKNENHNDSLTRTRGYSPFQKIGVGLFGGALALTSLLGGVSAAQAADVPLKGGIGSYYNRDAGVRNMIGSPQEAEKCGFQGNGCKQNFQRGEITWHSSVGSMAVRSGGIRNFYDSKGGPNSAFGYATSQVTKWGIGKNGHYLNTKNPTNGAQYRIVWSDEVGAVPVKMTGAVGARWNSNPSRYGHPVATEKYDSATKTSVQRFKNKDIVWSHDRGSFETGGGIGHRYLTSGGPSGNIGYPVSEEYVINDGRAQKFYNPKNGVSSTITWSRSTGKTYLMRGAINSVVQGYYGVNGPLGTPRSDERGGLTRGGVYQVFSNGRAYWSPTTGAHGVRGGILAAYEKQGFEHGLGYPTSNEVSDCGNGKVAQHFEYGTIHYDHGRSSITYSKRGWNHSDFDKNAAKYKFGRATSGAFENKGVIVKKYSNGVMTYSTKYGYQAMSNKVYEVWGPGAHIYKLPKSSSGWGSGFGMQTTFENGQRVAYDVSMRKVVRADKTLGSRDALVIGDSQVFDTSWVGRGIKAAGFNPEFYRMGGIGFQSRGSHTSYHDGVVGNQWALPRGNPGVIYVQGSGNDSRLSRDSVGYAVDRTITELHRLYPKSKIVVGGVLSRSEDNAANRTRWAIDDFYGQRVAKYPYVKFMSEKGWVTRYGATGYLQDSVHFNPQGQIYMAPHFAENFKKML